MCAGSAVGPVPCPVAHKPRRIEQRAATLEDRIRSGKAVVDHRITSLSFSLQLPADLRSGSIVLQADLTAGRLVWQHVLRRTLRHAPCLELLAPPKEPTLTLHRVHYSERVERGRSTASSGFSTGSACMIPAMARACVFPGAASTLPAGQAQDPG